jgi:prophage tail gpP-like protein
VRGRGKTADLVDCSARHSTGRFVQAGAQAILIQLCEPYGISVEVDPTMAPDALARLIADIVKPLKKFRLRVGDTPFAAIEKLAKERAFLVFESTRGTLVITRAGATPTTIIDRTRGEQWTRETDESNVFSEYEILGQHWGSNTWNGDDARGARGTIADDAATRFRPMTIVAERSVASADLTARATYERNQRRGLAERVGVTVSGWTYAPGLLWDIGQRVTLDNPFLGVTGEFLVYDVVMRRDRNGATTALTCAPPEAFEPFDPPKKKPEKRKTGKALDPLAIALASHTQLLATFAANLAGLKAKKVSK